jgi:putative CocE/NonD family hydrolase
MRADNLVFQSAPLENDLEVTGPLTVKLWISSSAPDTDFTAKLLDIYPSGDDYPEGYHLNLADAIIRCRYRNGFDHEEMMTPGEIYPVEITLPPTSNLFKKGHSIRLDISSSNFPRFDLNPNTGEPMGRHTRMDIAYNSVHCDAAHPSHIVLPVIPLEVDK